MDFFTGAFEIMKSSATFVAQQIRHVRNLNKNVKDLKTRRDELTSRGNDVSNEVERAKLQRMVPLGEVNNWLENVKDIKDEVRDIEKEFEERGCLPNYYKRWKLSKRALETTSEVDRLHGNGLFEGGVAVDPLPATAHTLPTISLVGKTRAEENVDLILDWLMDAEVGIIGVHGMGGVGKTTIMKNLNNRLKDDNRFRSVIWVTVSQGLNLQKLQENIAKKIGLDLSDDQDDESRSTTLHEALMQRQKFLLILDDIWEAFPLEKVGIPKPSRGNGCKIVLTTRSLTICHGMKTDRELRIEVLSEKEAWALLQGEVSGNMGLASNVQDVAKLVAKECGGLPLALITVAGALRKVNDIHEWRHALNQLRGTVAEMKGMQDQVFGRLKFSYDQLDNDKLRACFLFCSLYPEDYEIPVEELIQYWVWEGLIDEVDDTEAKIENGHYIVNTLVRSCMLESVGNKYIKMHDLVREMAISISRNSPRFIVKAGIGMREPLKDEEWVEDVERVSLARNKIDSLSATPNCPKLTTLFLQHNPLTGEISPSFFQQMSGLRVLDLSDTCIECLPDSLSELMNLRFLILRDCILLYSIPSLAKLSELRALDLSHTAIFQLPLGMEGLTNLRFLNLSQTPNMEIIRAGDMSNLIHLEILSMTELLFTPPFKPQHGCIYNEIASLTRLADLTLYFPDLLTFSSYVKSGHWRNLKKFYFNVGELEEEFNSEFDRSLCFQELEVGAGEIPLLLPGNTHELYLYRCESFSQFSLLPVLNMKELKSCTIDDCDSVECFLSEDDDASFLITLELLQLLLLPSLQAVCQGVEPPGTFQSLKLIRIEDCHKLKYLFTGGLLTNLQNLQEISIIRCHELEELVADEEKEEGIREADNNNRDNTITLPRLKNIQLHDANNLKRICGKVLVCNSMLNIKIIACPNLKKIPLSISNSSIILHGEIKGTGKWWDALEWNDGTTKPLLLPLFKEERDEEKEESAADAEDETD